MTSLSNTVPRLAVLAIACAWVAPALALEASLDVTESHLTQNLGDQHSQWLLVSVPGGNESLLQFSLENKRAFGEHAVIGGVAYGWNLSPLDRVSLAASGSDAPTIAAQWRVDAQYSRKLLAERNLVASIGGYSSGTRDGHYDDSLVASAAWYFADRQVAEGGVRYTTSNPGDHSAWRGFAAYTYGAVGESTVLVRIESGREAYQSLGVGGAVADFESREAEVAYRHWFDTRMSVAVHASYYRNPSYDKRALGVACFIDF